MRQGLRNAMTFAALTVLVGACTIEDAKETRAADSIAALSSKSPPAAPSSARAPVRATTAAYSAAPTPADSGARTATSPASTPASTSAPAPASTHAPAPAFASDSAGSLAPDSVDVGRRTKANLHPLARLRIEVDLAAKQLTVLDGDQSVATYRIAIGSAQWPTQTGQWEVKQVVWNPEWIPPKDEAWAEDRNPKQPGAPDNPLGRAQLVYDPPRTVHGTNDPASIGKAVSHGSIRMANADIVQLARRVMDMAGTPKDESFYQRVRQHRTDKVVVDLPQRVPIRVF